MPLATRASRALLVTVEGIAFSGKSTLVTNPNELLSDLDPPPFFPREPGGTPAAERIRQLRLNPGLDMDPWTEVSCYAGAPSDLVRREFLPRPENGEGVICDRFLDSSLAYQGARPDLGLDAVRGLNA